MGSLSPFTVEMETAPNRMSLVFDNKAGFIKLYSFHFPILTLNLNPWTKVDVAVPGLCFTGCSPTWGCHSTSHGTQTSQGCLQPEILSQGLEEDSLSLCVRPAGNSGCPELSVLGSHGRSAPGRAGSSLSTSCSTTTLGPVSHCNHGHTYPVQLIEAKTIQHMLLSLINSSFSL